MSRSRGKHNEQQPDRPLNRKTQPSPNGRLSVLSDVAANEPTTDLDHDIEVLRNYSLVKLVAGSTSFEMHGLVKLATQDWLTSSGTFERWDGQFMMNFKEAFPRAYFAERELCQVLFPHVLAAMEVKLNGRNSVLRQASILEKGGMHDQVTGAYDLSHRMIEQAFRSRVALLGPEQECTVGTMQYLGIAYANIEQREKAEIILSEALDRSKRLWGDTTKLHCKP